MHIHAHACTYMHIHAHTCTYMHSHTCTYMHIHAHTCRYMQIHAHTCTYMHIHAHTCTYMHIHAHTVQCLLDSGTCLFSVTSGQRSIKMANGCQVFDLFPFYIRPNPCIQYIPPHTHTHTYYIKYSVVT